LKPAAVGGIAVGIVALFVVMGAVAFIFLRRKPSADHGPNYVPEEIMTTTKDRNLNQSRNVDPIGGRVSQMS
jgi:hypothetical protein